MPTPSPVLALWLNPELVATTVDDPMFGDCVVDLLTGVGEVLVMNVDADSEVELVTEVEEALLMAVDAEAVDAEVEAPAEADGSMIRKRLLDSLEPVSPGLYIRKLKELVDISAVVPTFHG